MTTCENESDPRGRTHGPKRYGTRSGCVLEHPNGRTDFPGLKTAPNPDAVSQLLNTAIPMSSRKGTDPARGRDGTAGEGGGKKRMPSCNATDSPNG